MTDTYLNFLIGCQEFIHTDSSITSALRFQNVKKCRELQKQRQIDLPPKFFSTTVRCKFCCTEWSLGCFHARLTPSKHPGRKVKKILQKGKISLESLSKFEQGLFKKCQENEGNLLVLRCLVCKKKTVIKLQKPSYAKVSVKTTEEDETNIKTFNIKKRKRKNKRNAKASDMLLPLNNVKKFSKRSEKNKSEKQNVLLLNENVTPNTGENNGPYISKKKSKEIKVKIDDGNTVTSGRVKKRAKKLGRLHAQIAEDARKKVGKNSLADFMTFLST